MSSSTTKTRSPNYPSINLADAIDRVKTIYEMQRRYPATREVIAKLLGYSSLNGASATLISALSKYGLLEGHGDQLRVSGMGEDLALHRAGDQEFTEAVKTAAFMPAFFRELRDQYPDGLPHEHSLRASLMKRGFSPKAIDSALRSYRDTLEFIEIQAGASTENSARENGSDVPTQSSLTGAAGESQTHQAVHMGSHLRAVNLPLTATEWATLQAPFPLNEIAWDQMIAVLMAMKPALVTSTGQVDITSVENDLAGETP